MIPCRAGCSYTAVGQFTGHWWMDNRRAVCRYLSTVCLNCTHCFVMMFCISKIVRNGVLVLNLGNCYLLQVIQFLAAYGGVIILWRHLWTTSVSSFMCTCPFIRIYQLSSHWTNICKIRCWILSLIYAEKICQKYVNSHEDLGSFHIAENNTYSSAVQWPTILTGTHCFVTMASHPICM